MRFYQRRLIGGTVIKPYHRRTERSSVRVGKYQGLALRIDGKRMRLAAFLRQLRYRVMTHFNVFFGIEFYISGFRIGVKRIVARHDAESFSGTVENSRLERRCTDVDPHKSVFSQIHFLHNHTRG